MHFAQYYLDCLSHASYLIADETTGRAVVVDPRRDVDEYLADAGAAGFTVEAVINTHFHADFLAGHLELADRTGAWIGYGRRAETEYPIRRLADGERISLGQVTLQIVETPGHTPESISVLVFARAEDTVPYGVLTGDTLFVGDVGRPDLLASVGVSAEELGGMLHDSVHRKLLALPDEVRVFPAHGAGSACGKNLSTDRQSTIGRERATNPACAPMEREAFVALVTEGQSSAPGYFGYDADLNRRDRALLEPPVALTAERFRHLRAEGAVVVDGRDPQEFAAGHLAGSINLPADGRFAEQAGTVLRPEQPVLVLASDGRGAELVTRLARIGFDRAAGYLGEPAELVRTAPELFAPAARLTVAELARAEAPLVLDVRTPGERAAGAIPGSVSLPLAELPERMAELPADRLIVAHCAGGNRSSVAASLLRRAGFPRVADLLGGYAAWTQAGNESAGEVSR
ncbi:MBL fold metallo-hydrolase [Kitasatospora viridis]|uniref:Glyoxylase-like metal-dependent hydrolase (Beta-lactamase superfamily II) n=1 Tax=Kitasatospora viridis TaxID=281105 RepID=A0A561T6W3_9ACTN|nr:MBL fold metallo-hydrolase [Kitasatospora viridis]TWF82855.1 glyoxylase-like metal-dependent hydrolase (beta-lactamase superfamily II) [Kitasatospora viridis]